MAWRDYGWWISARETNLENGRLRYKGHQNPSRALLRAGSRPEHITSYSNSVVLVIRILSFQGKILHLTMHSNRAVFILGGLLYAYVMAALPLEPRHIIDRGRPRSQTITYLRRPKPSPATMNGDVGSAPVEYQYLSLVDQKGSTST
ncbi:hypothetical protein M413DRAFT_14353 [Hebeloma cylindrosporum]|uniref:Uncharacterized protein n=1 Tax=Hebeloma cylindrosporum TaxID=76867 RepID=A0A0C3BGC1_HEBCY|nr:hypothetical protein M413DRAFT_14353 [Hebeloma cylindrosporum h7]